MNRLCMIVCDPPAFAVTPVEDGMREQHEEKKNLEDERLRDAACGNIPKLGLG